MAAAKGRGWDDSLKDLQARIDALAREKGADDKSSAHSSAEVARALRAHRRRPPARPESEPDSAAPPRSERTPSEDEAGGAIVYRRDLPRQEAPTHARARPPGSEVTLEEAVDGDEVEHPDRGKLFTISTRVDDLVGAKHLSGDLREQIAAPDSAISRRILASTNLEDARPEDLVFFDIESTGLAYSPLFLIGAMVWEDGGFVVEQFLARNYAEEGAVIASFADVCRGRRLLVSFNGKSFDLPSIRVRAAATRVDLKGRPDAHFDLLHECRRVWRDVLPDCRLQTLELRVCSRLRRGDIPSAEIPRAYHSYVRTADAWEIVEVLKHNMLDLVTLADLMTRLPPLEEPSEEGGSSGGEGT
jgi:uncharacterized protein YprB with RNaseH-like and TPR domain